ncbi:MAG: type III pantothenate kinase [Chloroflexi bacterium]|nr:type III pantothenate kinase [Chloroflexota bacterium]
MLLAIDVGNTAIKLGVFDGPELRASWRWATDPSKLTDEYAVQLGWHLDHAELSPEVISRAIFCSVVPQLTVTFRQLCQEYLGSEPLRVSADLELGVRLRVDNPQEVGADRIANAAAAQGLYQLPAIIVDFGTATNFDVVSRDGDFLGGCFAPGIESAVDGLLARAALLRRFDLVAPAKTIGTNTVMCLQAGTIFGYTALVEGLVRRIEDELGERALVIGTGGLVETIASQTKAIQVVDQNLTLQGLRLLSELNPGVVGRAQASDARA